eukprot:5126656-Pyramimonas_sp.AAC.1
MQSPHNHWLPQLGHTPEQLLHTGRLHAPFGLRAFPGHLPPAWGGPLRPRFQHVSRMDIALLLLEVDREPDRGILGLPLLEADDLGRVCMLSGGLAASRSPIAPFRLV